MDRVYDLPYSLFHLTCPASRKAPGYSRLVLKDALVLSWWGGGGAVCFR